jgi:hypothetical protein
VKKVTSFLLLFIFFIININAQSIHIQPSFNKQPLTLNKPYTLRDGNTFTFSVIKFYVSNITWFDTIKHEVVQTDTNAYLINVEDPSSMNITTAFDSKKTFHNIEFIIGLDSVHQTANYQWGNYSPLQGMFWTWHSGYLNIKLEGTCSQCETRLKEFTHHLGGYRVPYISQQKISLNTSLSNINIDFCLDNYLDGINFKTEADEMTPGAHTVYLSKKIIEAFQLRIP